MSNNRYYIYCCNYNAQPVHTHNRYKIVTVLIKLTIPDLITYSLRIHDIN